MKRNFINR